MWTSPRADKAESLPSMLRLDAPIAPVQQSHAGVHRGGNIRRTTGLCVPCVGRLLRRLRLLLHGARNDRAYHRRRRFKLETCNVAAREAARRRLFLLLACSRLALSIWAVHGLSMGCSHGPRSSPTPVHAGPRSVSVHRESSLGRRDWVAHCSVSIASVRNSGSACFSVLQVLKLHLPPVRLKSLSSHSPTALPTNHYLSLGCAEKSRVNTTLATSRWPFDLP